MHRRTLMLSAGAAALDFARSAPASAATARILRFGYGQSEDSPLGAGAQAFATEINKRTSGRYQIEQYANAAFGDEDKMFKGTRSGSIDLAFITSMPLINYVMEIGVFNIPFLFHDAIQAHSMLDGPIGLACLEKFQDKDVIALAWGENGMHQLTNSKRPIVTPDDFKGLKFGLSQSAVTMIGFEAFGANVGAVTLPALFGVLQSGQFDGQESPLATIQTWKLWRVQKYLTVSNHIYDPAVIIMSSQSYQALSNEDQEVFAEAARLAGLASRRYAAQAHAHGIENLRQSGMQLIPEINRTKFLAAMDPAIQKFERLFGAGLVDWVQNAG